MRATLAACLLAVATPALADSTTGTVATWDAAAGRLAMADRTVWYLPASVTMPLNLAAGDRIEITYVSNADNGWGRIVSILRTEAKKGTGG
ncbi:MAG: hypothetical protein KDK24_05965 [Pseudooceanicola sp.]|nr:hypothetical protein [Pseudooceanicola sp.]MCB1356223.1 hypothetical protein [Maritimibacter sp.]